MPGTMIAQKLASVVTVAALVLILSSQVLGADDAISAGRNSGKLAIPDEEFVRKAAQDALMEVKLGELAEQKGMREDVKKFGERMAADHTNANDELKKIALGDGLALPDTLDAVHEGAVGRLAQLEGDQFDKAYIDDMVKDHAKAVGEFERASKNVSDAGLRAFVIKILPTLKAHLEIIKGLQNAPSK